MTEDEILFADFPSEFDQLCAEREANKSFQDLCADFAAIKLEILKLSQEQNTNDKRYLADLTESLEDLRHDIKSALSHPRGGPTD